MASAGKTVFAQFTKAQSIHRGFYQWKTMDDNQKQLTPQLAIDTEFANPCTCKPKDAVRAVCALVRNRQLGA
jgi:hypothetical protein